MAVVVVDDRGRLSIPKNFGMRGGRAIVIPAGTFFVIVPLPKHPSEFAKGWLASKETRVALKAMAERRAKADAAGRARRRKQL